MQEMLHAVDGDGTSVEVQQSLDAQDGLAVRLGQFFNGRAKNSQLRGLSNHRQNALIPWEWL